MFVLAGKKVVHDDVVHSYRQSSTPHCPYRSNTHASFHGAIPTTRDHALIRPHSPIVIWKSRRAMALAGLRSFRGLQLKRLLASPQRCPRIPCTWPAQRRWNTTAAAGQTSTEPEQKEKPYYITTPIFYVNAGTDHGALIPRQTLTMFQHRTSAISTAWSSATS